MAESVLVHLAAGIGNIVLATPLLVALGELGFRVDVWLSADYPQTADLLRPWKVVHRVFQGASLPSTQQYAYVIAATPPFYWSRFAARFAGLKNLVPRPPAWLFYQNEQEFYLSFARHMGMSLGQRQFCVLPIAPNDSFEVSSRTVVLAPGCKTGEMTAKRWPHFPQLAEAFADVALVGTGNDLRGYDGRELKFPSHVRSFVDRLTLRQTAELLAAAGVVVAGDCGLAHIAAAVGTLTIMIFGPTPDRTLGALPPNVTVLRRGLACEPCWFGARFGVCGKKMTCLEELMVETVVAAIEQQCLTPNFRGTRQLSDEIQKASAPVG